jgi:hypothetical protein
MRKRTYYSIIDHENRVVGEWTGAGIHLVMLYESRSCAKKEAIKLRIPDYQIVRAEVAMRLPQSPYSR